MVGELAMGRFRLLERLGTGGMGTVYRALDERLQREVAVKEIEGADARRVLREAKAAARLNHPAIVTLYEFGSDGRRALLVSELAKGQPLDVLSDDAAISDREVGTVGVSICAALAHAHERGIVHRDVKPQNIVVDLETEPPRAKLMDFGIASIAGEARLTAAGEVVGTLAYMSPEQAEGEWATEASDVYSLALTLYESWSGSNPVAASTPAATARRIGSLLPSLAESRPDLPEPLVAAIDDCLEPDARARPHLGRLSEALESSLDLLDDEQAVPGHSRAGVAMPSLRAAGVLTLAAFGLLVAALAGPAGRPGLALVLGLLVLPAVVFAAHPARALLPALAGPLAAASLGAAYPALAARGESALERVALGALGWLWMAAAWLALGLGPSLPFAERAPDSWSGSASSAASGVLAPLADPTSLGAAAAFAIAAWALGPILRAGHVSLALLGALVWGAALDAALDALGLDALSPSPLLAAGAAAALVLVVFGSRPRARSGGIPPPALAHGAGPSRA
jgi:tRNA A-37 threonylcarbamoyl transferase component Bud32